MIKPTTTTKAKSLPPEHSPKRKCRCGDCRNEIHAMTLCRRVNSRNVCESCGDRYRWNPASQQWELAPEPGKPKIGRPTMGEVACEARWHAKVTNEEDALLQRLADEFTRGNKSEMLRLAVKRMAEPATP